MPISRGLRSVAVNAGYILASRAIAIPARAAYMYCLAAYLGPQLYGLLAYATSWYNVFLPVTFLGMAVILARGIGHDREQGRLLVSSTFAVRLVAVLVVAIASLLIAAFVESDPRVLSLLALSAIALVGASLSNWCQNVFVAFEAARYNFWQDAIFRPLEIIVSLAALLSGADIVAIMAIHAGCWVLQAAQGLRIVSRRLAPLRGRLRWPDVRSLLSSGLILGVAAAAAGWQVNGSLVLFRHFGSSSEELGQYALALQAFVLLSTLPTAASVAALPVISRSVSRGDGKDAAFMGGMCRLVAMLGTLAVLGGFALAPGLVHLLFGPSYRLAGDLLGWVALLWIPFSMVQIMLQSLVARGHYAKTAGCTLAGAATLSIALPLLAPEMGAYGALLAASFGIMVNLLGLALTLARSAALDVAAVLVRPALMIATTVGVYLALEDSAPKAALAVALLVLFAGVVVFRLIRPSEWAAIRTFVRTRRSG